MTNPITGEVHFEARGQTFTFRMDTNAQVLIEDKAGMTMGKFFKERIEDLGATGMRLVFWAGLQRNHKMTQEDAGNLIDEIGPDRIVQIFLEAFAAAEPKSNGGADQARPPKAAKARIGMNS